jgi:transcriptional accessory protein Tex/SPT6
MFYSVEIHPVVCYFILKKVFYFGFYLPQFAKKEPALSLSDLHEGMVLPCVVALVKPFGVFLRLPTWRFRKSALVPTRHLADFFVENPRDFVQPFQTIFGKVLETDEEKQTVTMTTKRKAVSADGISHSVELVRKNCSSMLLIWFFL